MNQYISKLLHFTPWNIKVFISAFPGERCCCLVDNLGRTNHNILSILIF